MSEAHIEKFNSLYDARAYAVLGDPSRGWARLKPYIAPINFAIGDLGES